MTRLQWILAVAVTAALAGGCKKEQPKTTETEPAASAPAPAEATPEAPEPEPEMAMPAVGDAAPAFETVAHDGTKVSVAALRGEPFVLYFYPRDDTPG